MEKNRDFAWSDLGSRLNEILDETVRGNFQVEFWCTLPRKSPQPMKKAWKFFPSDKIRGCSVTYVFVSTSEILSIIMIKQEHSALF